MNIDNITNCVTYLYIFISIIYFIQTQLLIKSLLKTMDKQKLLIRIMEKEKENG